MPHLFYFLEFKGNTRYFILYKQKHILFIINTSILCDYFSEEFSTACNPRRLRIVILVLPSNVCANKSYILYLGINKQKNNMRVFACLCLCVCACCSSCVAIMSAITEFSRHV